MATTKISQKQVRGLDNALGSIAQQIEAVNTALAGKQKALSAGNGISIASDGTISSTATAYSAGSGISISDQGVISASAAAPAITQHTHLSGVSQTFAELSGKSSVKIYKNGQLLRPSGTEATPGTLEYVNVTGLSSLAQVNDAEFDLTVDGTAVNLKNIDFSGASSLEDVADIFETAAQGSFHCEVNSAGTGLLFISPTLGASSSVATNEDTAEELIAAMGGEENGNKVVTAGQAAASVTNDYSVSGTSVTFAENLNIHDVITTECL